MSPPDGGGSPRLAAGDAVDAYVRALPEPCTWERVRTDFWYVRVPGSARRWIPIEIELGGRTLKLTSHFCIPPEEREAEAYAYLLRHNHRAPGVAFSADREGVLCLVARLPLGDVDEGAIDDVVGRIVDATESTFQSYLRIGFASRFRR